MTWQADTIGHVAEHNRLLATTSVRPEDFGAVGDGVTDDRAALQAAFDSGSNVILTTGKTYAYADNLYLNVDGVTVYGNGATLYGSNELKARLFVYADNITLDHFKLTQQASTGRDSKERLTVYQTDGFRAFDVEVVDGRGAGFYIEACTNFKVQRCVVRNNRSDAFHVVRGCMYGQMLDLEAYNCGDDMFANVGYEDGNGSYPQYIYWRGCRGRSQTSGRGMSVIGGSYIIFQDCHVWDTSAAGMTVACEPSFQAYGSSHILFDSCSATRPNMSATTHNGGVFLYNSRADHLITDVTFRNCTVTDMNDGPWWGDFRSLNYISGGFSQIHFENCYMRGNKTIIDWAGTYPYTPDTVDIFDVPGIKLDSSGDLDSVARDLSVTRNLYAANRIEAGDQFMNNGPWFYRKSAPGIWRGDIHQTDTGLNRWRIGSNDAAETGGNAGTDFVIDTFNDAGSYNGQALRISRGSGNVTIWNSLYLNGGLILSGSKITSPTYNVVNAPGAGYTLNINEYGGFVVISSASFGYIVIPSNATTAIPVGAVYTIFNNHSSATRGFSLGSGVTLAAKGTPTLSANGVVTLVKIATDSWIGYGDLT